MKAKLIKLSKESYKLVSLDGEFVIKGKLSKSNCDEVFGIFDGEIWADEEVKTFRKGDERLQRWFGFKNGFNKAIDLNKDKLFTLDNMRYFAGFTIGYTKNGVTKDTEKVLEDKLKSLIQPTEIEIEIVTYKDGDIRTQPGNKNIMFEHSELLDPLEYKLDSEGCLILKKYEKTI